MYLDRSKTAKKLVIGIIATVLGFIMFFLNFLIIMAFIVENDTEYIGLFVFFTIVGIAVIILGINNLVFYGTVNHLNRIFLHDSDGFIRMDDIVKNKSLLFKMRVQKAIDKNYFTSLTYDAKNRVFNLSDRVRGAEDYTNRFIGKNCPNCGAPLKIRKGTAAVCEQCGSRVGS